MLPPFVHRLLIPVYLAATVACQAFPFVFFDKAGEEYRLTVGPSPLHYYRLQHSDDLRQFSMLGMAQGMSGPVFAHTPPPGTLKGFYRVQAIEGWAPEGTDLDGMDDLWELQNGLNPLDAADAAHAAAEHAMATEALAQMYLAARSGSKSLPGMREAFENGIRHIIQSHATASGSAGNSLLTLAWQAEALNTARLTKLKFDGLSECMARLAFSIKQAQKPDGSFSGQAAETQRAITGACLRALQILPGDHQAAIAKGIQFARQHYQKEPLDRSKMDLHAVFFLTRAFFRQGSDDWRFWNYQMLPQVLAALKPDGSISCPPSALMPGDDSDNTALAALTLETYFRDTPK